MRTLWLLLLVACQQQDEEVESLLALVTDLQNGEQIYADSCASCHGADGEGGAGPSFVQAFAEIHDKDGSWEDDLRVWVRTILDGAGTMPSWRGELSDQDVADVIEYVHHTWGM